jgi:hypothetical protein
MTRCTRLLHNVLHLAGTLLTLLVDVVRCLHLCLRLAAVLTDLPLPFSRISLQMNGLVYVMHASVVM